MLISLIERFQRDGENEVIPYALWAAALHRFKNDCDDGGIPDIAQIKSYLIPVPENQTFGACCDLIAGHMTYSWSEGMRNQLEDYLNLIPQLSSLEKIPADLIEDEFLARYDESNGDFPEVREYRQRFPGRPEVIQKLQSRCMNGEHIVKLRRIGCGATSIVWKAFDHRTGHMVAVKEAIADAASTGLSLFETESAITAGLDHLGIVNIFETGRGGKSLPFCVMKMGGEEVFSARIQDHHKKLEEHKKSIRKRQDWIPLLQDIIRICEAVEYAHNHHILHCDLKPGNLVCGKADQPGIIDWGMAIKTPTSGTGKHISGTPEYMAPEQVDGAVSVRSDIYSLGAILYETLTGQAPFPWTKKGIENRPEEWRDLVRSSTFQIPRKAKRHIPKQLESICLKAMAQNPKDRYQTAAGLASDLREYISPKAGKFRFRKK